jgi:hypothetical protein
MIRRPTAVTPIESYEPFPTFQKRGQTSRRKIRHFLSSSFLLLFLLLLCIPSSLLSFYTPVFLILIFLLLYDLSTV